MTDIEKLRELLGKATPGPWALATAEPSATGALYPYAMWVNGAGPRLVQVGKGVCIHADDMALIVELRNAIGPLLDRVEKMEANARRYQQIIDDPEAARHLLHLLQQGKGGVEAFSKMLDRIADSKAAALRGKGE